MSATCREAVKGHDHGALSFIHKRQADLFRAEL